MRTLRWRHSLKSRIVVSYSLILVLGGLSTSIIGIYVTERALLRQARQQTVYGAALARTIYAHRLQELQETVTLAASMSRLQAAMATGETNRMSDALAALRRERGLDFLSITDDEGRVVQRCAGPGDVGDTVSGVDPIRRALAGEPAAGTELLPLSLLRTEDPPLADRAVVPLPPKGVIANGNDSDAPVSGLALVAAVPVRIGGGRVVGVVYGGELLNGERASGLPPPTTSRAGEAPPGPAPSRRLVDRIDATMLSALDERDLHRGVVTVFQDDLLVCTNYASGPDAPVVGTRAPSDIRMGVIDRGDSWSGQTSVGDDTFIAVYQPITNLANERIGMLGIGLSKRPYMAVRNRVFMSFVTIALLCFLLIVVVTYFLTRSLVRPLEEMVSVSRSIAGGDWSRRVETANQQSELGLLSVSFNDMLDRISDMRSELETWAKTLEQKVEERSEQLAKVQAQAARQQRLASVGQLAAGVAHEINNPLGGILTFASLMLEDLRPGDPHHEDLDEIVRQAVRCRKIVTGLLEFSRKREADMAPANVNEVLARTLALLETQAIFHDIQIKRRFDPNMPTNVMDESQMQQVFMNLILNAVDAMDGHGQLTIETRHSKVKSELMVRITDTGSGIPEKIRESIFDPFFTTKDPGKGTGLGLAVSWKIVQAHGGRTEVESEVGRGTAFTVYLPLEFTRPEDSGIGAAQ